MLFNSYIFIFAFLPITFCVYHLCRRAGFFRGSICFLILASLVYYGWWSPKYLFLIVTLTLFNFFMGRAILFTRKNVNKLPKILLIIGLCVNIGALCYYKYANFIVDNLNDALGWELYLRTIVLPIGISFFTFQKIAFLIDIYQGKVEKITLIDFALFVTFFPQLIAGPITHHSEVIPQFQNSKAVSLLSIRMGITIFVLGLAKKVIFADTAARFASPQFNAVAGGLHLDLLAAWSGALAYTAQLYFDFSAYSDMAIGLGQLFGINLPINFNSPYKSTSIIEFWRRWHITLSRFLRDYLYIPLGGNRKGPTHRYVNLMITMILGGIWHGAGWTFLVWGLLHGIYLTVNHGWRSLNERFKIKEKNPIARSVAWLTTFLAVVTGWVFFRAADIETALDMLKSMLGLNGFAVPDSLARFAASLPHSSSPMDSGIALLATIPLLLIAWFAPNTQELMRYTGPQDTGSVYELKTASARSTWQPTLGWAIYTGCLFAFSLMLFSHISEFIYFQF